MLKKILLTSIFKLTSVSANASLVYSDWLIEGDNKAVLDEGTGIEYLNTGITRGLSINETSARMLTDLSGWRFAEGHEIRAMINGFFARNGGGEGSMLEFNNLFTDSSYPYTYATYQENGGIYMAGRNYATTYLDYEYTAYTLDSKASHQGVWLASDGGLTLSSSNNASLNANNPNAPVADVSASFSLGGLVMLGVGFRRKLKNKSGC